MLILIVASGPDKGRVFELTDEKTITVGRDGDPVRLHDRKVSRQHAKLTCEGGAWTLEDLGSRHGTYRNRQKITGSVPVRDGDVLQVGKTMLVASRLQVEQAERLALLGAVPTAAQAMMSARPVGVRWRRVSAVAASVAVAGLVGLNLYHMQQTHERSDELARQIEDAADLARQQDGQLLAAVESMQSPSELESVLREVVALAKAQQAQQQMLADLQSAVAQLPEAQQPMLESMLAELQRQRPQADRLAAIVETLEAHRNAAGPLVEQLRAVASAGDAEADRLGEVLAAIERRPTAEQLEARFAARDAIVTQRLDALVTAMPDTAPLKAELALLRDAVAAQPTRADALIERALVRLEAQRSADQLEQVLAALEQRPTLEQVDARLTAITRSGSQTAAQIQQLAAAMPDTDALQREVAAVRAMIEAQPTRLEELLDQSLARVDGDPQPALDLDRLHGDIAAIKASLPADLSQRLDRVVAQLDLMPSTDRLAAAVSAAIEKPEAVGPAIAQLREDIRQRPTSEQLAEELREVLAAQPDAVGPALRELSRRLDLQPTADQLARAVREAVAAQGEKLATLDAKLDALGERADAGRVLAALQDVAQQQDTALAAKLDALSQRLDVLAAADPAEVKQREVLAVAQEQTAKLLTDVLAAVQQTQPIDALREQVQALAAAVGESDQALAAVAESLQQRQAVDDKLASLHQRLASWPTDAGEQLDQILARLQTQEAAETGALRQVLAELRRQDDVLPSAAMSQSHASASSRAPIMQQVTPQRPSADVSNATAQDDANRPLTPTEEAYRTAFLTEQPVTIGGGVDPETGKLLPGRQLDPVTAKATGISTWREWYLIDGLAERMRLQKLAEEARQKNLTNQDVYRVRRVD